MKKIDVIIHSLKQLKEQYEEYGNEEGFVWWVDYFGRSLVEWIDCHTVFKDSTPCLNKVRNVMYGGDGWEKNCAECKAKWLMEEYE